MPRVDPSKPCPGGHVGWYTQRVMFDRDRGPEGTYYTVWVCVECARQTNLRVSRERRARQRIGRAA